MQMIQNSKEWLEWRRKGLGASDAPIVMDVSPYTTRHQLWLEKTGRTEPNRDELNAITERGHALEALARPQYELMMGYDIPPKLAEHPEFEYLRASLDGWNEERRLLVEHKWVGQKAFELVVETGKPLDHHIHQLEHQMFVTGTSLAHYVVYSEHHGRIHIVPYESDKNLLQEYLREAAAFWELVQTDTPPELTDRDEVEATGVLADMFERIRVAKLSGDTKGYKDLKNQAIAAMPHTRMRANGVLIYKTKSGGYQARVS